MKSIGGYFELELPPEKDFIHNDCLLVNSGRHALEYILRSIGVNAKRVFVPYYTCDVVLQPLKRLDIDYQFYHINQNLEIDSLPNLRKGDYVIINNYFGIKDDYIKQISGDLKDILIVDNAQALYAPVLQGIKSFYSPRKYFGVPDGGMVYTSESSGIELEQAVSYDQSSHLLKRIDVDPSAGYADFKKNALVLRELPMMKMSKLSQRLLSSIDFENARGKRRANYKILNESLGVCNLLQLPDMDSFSTPMVYPFLTWNKEARQRLLDNKIYVATYWPNVMEWCKSNMIEYDLAKYILPLPIDQRYGEEEMRYIIDLLK